VKKHLFAVMVVVSLVSACSGSEQATDVPGPTSVARATNTPEDHVLTKERLG
jgi:nitrous oxide reductase accessory protein NosL